MKMRTIASIKIFPTWLIYGAAIGLGFFGFVIAGGVLLNVAGRRFGGGAVLASISALVGLAAAYFAFKYSRRFMMGHVSKAAAAATSAASPEGGSEEPEDPAAPGARQKRLARSLLIAGVILFMAFIFTMLSVIINLYA